jgi:hypothetical protein
MLPKAQTKCKQLQGQEDTGEKQPY